MKEKENFCKTLFQVHVGMDQFRNKAEMKHARRLPYYRKMEEKKEKKTTLHLQHIQQI